MNEYNHIIKKAELALNNGDYKYCIEVLKPFIKVLPVSTKEGINIRFILITACSGISNTEDATFFCKQLIKSKYSSVREKAKSLLEIINSPTLKTPENWTIKIENKSNYSEDTSKARNKNKILEQKEKFINTSNIPTGETKPFQKGFTILVAIILFLVTTLLSGCVKIESNLDFRDLEEVKISHQIISKFGSKLPWQLNFENQLKQTYENRDIYQNKEGFTLRNKSIEIKQVQYLLNKFLQAASASTEIDLKNIDFKYDEKNYFLAKRYFFDIDVNLDNLDYIDNLEILINILSPSRVEMLSQNDNVNVSENNINWELEPGVKNHLAFKFLYWNKILISILFTLIIVSLAYIILRNRYELGSNLPRLPS